MGALRHSINVILDGCCDGSDRADDPADGAIR
jgi:hypothetical protein